MLNQNIVKKRCKWQLVIHVLDDNKCYFLLKGMSWGLKYCKNGQKKKRNKLTKTKKHNNEVQKYKDWRMHYKKVKRIEKMALKIEEYRNEVHRIQKMFKLLCDNIIRDITQYNIVYMKLWFSFVGQCIYSWLYVASTLYDVNKTCKYWSHSYFHWKN